MASHLFAVPHVLTESGSLLRAESGPAWEIGKAQTASLRSLGHKLERFLHARELVHRRIFQEETFAPLRPWFGIADQGPAPFTGEGTFVSALLRGDAGFKLGTVMLPPELASKSLSLWRQTDPEAPKVLSPLLPLLPDAEAPLWLALLRLRPLRGLWESALRRDHFETLLQTFPDAWLLDPTPLPPGAVIPRLEISRWERLQDKRHAGGRFAIASSDAFEGAPELDESISANVWLQEVQAALAAGATTTGATPRILVELPPAPVHDSWLLAFYEKKGSRVDAKGFLSLRKTDDDGWQAAKVR